LIRALDTIKRGILKIQSSEDQQWLQPGENRKRVMQSKFEELYQLVSAECDNYNQVYEKLLHDIKPKLTGLKTDEHENPWGNGMFSNPWIVDPLLREYFRLWSNSILSAIS